MCQIFSNTSRAIVARTRTLCQKNTERQFTPASARRTNSDIQDYCKSIIVDDPVVTTRLAGAGVRSGGKLVSRTVISSSPHSESFVLRVSHLLTYVDTALGRGDALSTHPIDAVYRRSFYGTN